MVTEATREFILHELDTYGRDRLQAGKEDRAREFARALATIEDGGDEVFVEHMLYRVVEDDLGEPKRNPDQAGIDGERDARIAAVQDTLTED